MRMPTPVGVVTDFLDAFAEHDLDAAIGCLAEDFYFVPSGHELAPARGDFSGHDGYREWWALVGAAQLNIHPIRVEEITAGKVFAEFASGREDSDAYVGTMLACVYLVRAGQIAAIEVFEDPERAYDRASRGSIGFG